MKDYFFYLVSRVYWFFIPSKDKAFYLAAYREKALYDDLVLKKKGSEDPQ